MPLRYLNKGSIFFKLNVGVDMYAETEPQACSDIVGFVVA